MEPKNESPLSRKESPPVALKEVERPIDPKLGEKLRALLLEEFRRARQPPPTQPPRGSQDAWADWPET